MCWRSSRLTCARGPLLRAHLLRLSAEEHVAVVVMHHIVSDGWSMGVLIREVGALYAAFVARRAVAAGRRLRCSMRTMRCGSAAGCRARRWSSRSRTGGSS